MALSSFSLIAQCDMHAGLPIFNVSNLLDLYYGVPLYVFSHDDKLNCQR